MLSHEKVKIPLVRRFSEMLNAMKRKRQNAFQADKNAFISIIRPIFCSKSGLTGFHSLRSI